MALGMRRAWMGALSALFTLNMNSIGFSLGAPSLAPFVLTPLPLGTISPKGWLADQMQTMASGLAGHSHDFYRFVAQSSWLGGNQEYSQLHEGFPYWLNGIVPLAYSLNDARLKDQIHSSVDYVLQHAAADGWLGPASEVGGLRNLWARYPMLMGLTGLLEADNATYGATVLPALRKFVGLAHDMLRQNGTGYLPQPNDSLSEEDHNWARTRVADMLLTLQWLYENDLGAGQGQVLLDTMEMLRKGSLDWAEWYQDGVYFKGDLSNLPDQIVKPWFPYEHGVNVAQGLKTGAVINRFTHNDTQIATSRRAVDWTFKYHGSTAGSILADERLEGLSPHYGSELCTTVETMFSLSYLYHALGDSNFADRAELAAFNALPAALMPDWWAHQYVSQPNQPYSKNLTDTPFWNVDTFGQTYGLEPNYPCCTVNHPQGYPKFLVASWAKVGNDGLGHALLSPSSLTTTLDNGAKVSVDVDTKYPFADTLSYSVSASKPFTLYVRIPSWSATSDTHVSVSGSQSSTGGVSPDSHTGLQAIQLPAGKSEVLVGLSRSVTTIPRGNNSAAIMHGPLLYTLDVGFQASDMAPKNYTTGKALTSGQVPSQARDWTILNTQKWNYAVDIATLKPKLNSDGRDVSGSVTIDSPLANPIWAPGAPPIYIEAEGSEVPWPIWKGVPGSVPTDFDRTGTRETLRFVPVGSAKIGMAELPVL